MYGLLGGVASVVFMFTAYFIDHNLVTSFFIMLAEVGVTVVFMVISVLVVRKGNGNYIEFKPALKASYGTAVLVWLIFCIFYFMMYKFIDPSLVDLYFKNMMAQGKAHGASEAEVAYQITLRQQQGLQFDNPKVMAFIYLFLAILSFFYALIISGMAALASKDNRPANIYTDQTATSN